MDTAERKWGHHAEYIFTCIGLSTGLGNVWRFPYMVHKNGGGAFLIPYTISLIFVGIPLFSLATLFGQFAGLGPIAAWEINVLFRGIGVSMMVLTGLISVYYSSVISTASMYILASLQTKLPWTECNNDWNTCQCQTSRTKMDTTESPVWKTKECRGMKSASEEYYYNKVLDITDGIFDLGKIKWDLTVCNLFTWIVVYIVLIKGIKTMGKAVYFFSVFPNVLMTALLIRGCTLDGASEGIEYFFRPDFEKLAYASVWRDAATQVLFALTCCSGCITAMASYNDFRDNFFRDSSVVPALNLISCIVSGVTIFSVLGFMSKRMGVPIENVTSQGTGLVFVVYPEGLAAMPVPHIWSVLFFFMMVTLGLGALIPGVESLFTSLQDVFPALNDKRKSLSFRLSACVTFFVLGLPFNTQGGFYVLTLCDRFVSFPLLLLGLLQIVSIVWVYGVRAFLADVRLMIGRRYCMRSLFHGFYSWNWVFLSPVLLIVIIVFDCITYEPITSARYPVWAEVLGWLIVLIVMICVPVWYVARYVYELRSSDTSESAWSVFKRMNRATPLWRPAFQYIVSDQQSRSGNNKYKDFPDQLSTRVEIVEREPSLTDVQRSVFRFYSRVFNSLEGKLVS